MAVSQSGSRAGLITALVIFVILFFVAAIFAVIKQSDYKDEAKKRADQQSLYSKVVNSAELNLANEEAKSKSGTFYSLAMAQREQLVRSLTGQDPKSSDAVGAWQSVVKTTTDRLKGAGAALPAGSASQMLDALTSAVVQRQETIASLNTQIKQLNDQLKQKEAAYQAATAEHQKAVENAGAVASAAGADLVKYQGDKNAQLATLEKSLQDAIEKDRKTAEDLNNQWTATKAELAKAQKDLHTSIERLAILRPQNLADASIRQADGSVVQVGRNDVAYINLGLGQQISPGMTFEIYDKNEGIPRVGNSTDDMPEGKGSLEVVRVGPGNSECRIIKLSQGSQVMVGDLIANLIYDPNVKWTFKVFGNFDIDQNGIPTPQETEIVKRLVVQWGGRLTEGDVNVDTDFVILGKEPTVPNYTAEQLEDPILKFEKEKKEKELTDYDAVKNKALELRVPVLNQNRFLYLIGYYDQAKK